MGCGREKISDAGDGNHISYALVVHVDLLHTDDSFAANSEEIQSSSANSNLMYCICEQCDDDNYCFGFLLMMRRKSTNLFLLKTTTTLSTTTKETT